MPLSNIDPLTLKVNLVEKKRNIKEDKFLKINADLLFLLFYFNSNISFLFFVFPFLPILPNLP